MLKWVKDYLAQEQQQAPVVKESITIIKKAPHGAVGTARTMPEQTIARSRPFGPEYMGNTGAGENGKIEPGMPVNLIESEKGPVMLHEGEELYRMPRGRIGVVPHGAMPQQFLAELEKTGKIPGMCMGGTIGIRRMRQGGTFIPTGRIPQSVLQRIDRSGRVRGMALGGLIDTKLSNFQTNLGEAKDAISAVTPTPTYSGISGGFQKIQDTFSAPKTSAPAPATLTPDLAAQAAQATATGMANTLTQKTATPAPTPTGTIAPVNITPDLAEAAAKNTAQTMAAQLEQQKAAEAAAAAAPPSYPINTQNLQAAMAQAPIPVTKAPTVPLPSIPGLGTTTVAQPLPQPMPDVPLAAPAPAPADVARDVYTEQPVQASPLVPMPTQTIAPAKDVEVKAEVGAPKYGATGDVVGYWTQEEIDARNAKLGIKPAEVPPEAQPITVTDLGEAPSAEYKTMIDSSLQQLMQVMNGMSDVDRTIANRYLQAYDAASASNTLSLMQRMASDPNMTAGAKNSMMAQMQRNIMIGRANLTSEMAIEAQKRAEQAASDVFRFGKEMMTYEDESLKWQYDQALAAKDWSSAASLYKQLTGKDIDLTQMQNDARKEDLKELYNAQLAAHNYESAAKTFEQIYGVPIDISTLKQLGEAEVKATLREYSVEEVNDAYGLIEKGIVSANEINSMLGTNFTQDQVDAMKAQLESPTQNSGDVLALLYNAGKGLSDIANYDLLRTIVAKDLGVKKGDQAVTDHITNMFNAFLEENKGKFGGNVIMLIDDLVARNKDATVEDAQGDDSIRRAVAGWLGVDWTSTDENIQQKIDDRIAVEWDNATLDDVTTLFDNYVGRKNANGIYEGWVPEEVQDPEYDWESDVKRMIRDLGPAAFDENGEFIGDVVDLPWYNPSTFFNYTDPNGADIDWTARANNPGAFLGTALNIGGNGDKYKNATGGKITFGDFYSYWESLDDVQREKYFTNEDGEIVNTPNISQVVKDINNKYNGGGDKSGDYLTTNPYEVNEWIYADDNEEFRTGMAEAIAGFAGEGYWPDTDENGDGVPDFGDNAGNPISEGYFLRYDENGMPQPEVVSGSAMEKIYAQFCMYLGNGEPLSADRFMSLYGDGSKYRITADGEVLNFTPEYQSTWGTKEGNYYRIPDEMAEKQNLSAMLKGTNVTEKSPVALDSYVFGQGDVKTVSKEQTQIGTGISSVTSYNSNFYTDDGNGYSLSIKDDMRQFFEGNKGKPITIAGQTFIIDPEQAITNDYVYKRSPWTGDEGTYTQDFTADAVNVIGSDGKKYKIVFGADGAITREGRAIMNDGGTWMAAWTNFFGLPKSETYGSVNEEIRIIPV